MMRALPSCEEFRQEDALEYVRRVGLTPEIIRKFVVKIEPPLPAYVSKCHLKYEATGRTRNGRPVKQKRGAYVW